MLPPDVEVRPEALVVTSTLLSPGDERTSTDELDTTSTATLAAKFQWANAPFIAARTR